MTRAVDSALIAYWAAIGVYAVCGLVWLALPPPTQRTLVDWIDGGTWPMTGFVVFSAWRFMTHWSHTAPATTMGVSFAISFAIMVSSTAQYPFIKSALLACFVAVAWGCCFPGAMRDCLCCVKRHKRATLEEDHVHVSVADGTSVLRHHSHDHNK